METPIWPAMTIGDLPKPDDYGRFRPFLKGVFSQWHATAFVVESLTFATAEQWMMYCKARLFDDDDASTAILATPDPSLQKRLGQGVSGFDTVRWDAAKIGIVYRGNMEKFRQNPGARRQLAATEDAMLVEANPRDWIWGAGLSEHDPGLSDAANWRGENLLGRILTKVRIDLGVSDGAGPKR
jgi:ribA/ribD-fused uncharacterized protein